MSLLFFKIGYHGNLVKMDPSLKKGHKYGGFVVNGKWGQDTLVAGENMKVKSS